MSEPEERPIVYTPSAMKARLQRLHAELNRQSSYVHLLDAPTQRTWNSLRDRWKAWIDSEPSLMWGATMATADVFSDEIGAFAVQIVRAGGPAPARDFGAAVSQVGPGSGSLLVVAAIVAGVWLWTSRK
jgi:hypothetical protein